MAKKVKIKKGREKSVIQGHPWIYSGAIKDIDNGIIDGEIVNIISWDRKFLGRGYFNSKSQIAIRILTTEDVAINREFFQQRIRQAINFRFNFPGNKFGDNFRLIFSEADLLPGLIVDQYGQYLAIQIGTAGMETKREMIIDILISELDPKGIFECSDTSSRKLEGLPPARGVIKGEVPEKIAVAEDGILFELDLRNSQKTGLYLDQKMNRLKTKKLTRGKRVLDLFCYNGGFSLHSAKGGASEVIGVDISSQAIHEAENNANLNQLGEICRFFQADAFEFLRKLKENGEQFDVIIIDPPAFARNKRAIAGACRGYKDLNLLALKLLKKDGILITSSCSQLITPQLFQQVLFSSAVDAKREVQIIEKCGASFDHPVRVFFPESEYLKCFFCRVL